MPTLYYYNNTTSSWEPAIVGEIGATGPQGDIGATGETGATGVAGIDGATGATGVAGIDGATGATGVAGIDGATGATGVAGVDGATGATGVAGADGATGATGETGATGTAANTGNLEITGTVIEFAAGATEELITISPDGLAGQAGIQLPKNSYANVYYAQLTNTGGNVRISAGDSITVYDWIFDNTGNLILPGNTLAVNYANGTQVPLGATGATGPAGTIGVDGSTGATGPAGIDGATGATGIEGPTGATGATGIFGGALTQNLDGNGFDITNVATFSANTLQGTSPNVSIVSGVYTWTFDNTGNLVLSGNTFAVNYANGTQVSLAGGATGATGPAGADGATGSTGPVGATGSVVLSSLTGNIDANGYNISNVNNFSASNLVGTGNSVILTADTYDWTFDNTGNLILPGNTFAVNYANGAQVSLAGGATGATGPAGVDGATGATGVAGPAGVDGATGATGPQGDTGATGVAGLDGATGATGVAGTNGTDGSTGATGVAGVDGATGATGTAGVDGATGATGVAGVDGATGATGIAGVDGATGAAGVDGATGATGVAGLDGATGATGLTGATGPVAGSNTQVIFNDDGNAGASANLTFDSANNVLSVVGNLDVSNDIYANNYINFRGNSFIGDETSGNIFRIVAPLGYGVILETDADISGNNYQFDFGADSTLGVPGNINFSGDPSAAPSLNDFFSVTSGANFTIVTDNANAGHTFRFDNNGNLNVPDAIIGTGNLTLYNISSADESQLSLSGSGVSILTDDGNREWIFDTTGTLTAPGDITVGGDITGTAGANTLILKAQPTTNTYIQLNSIVDSTIRIDANLEIITDSSNTSQSWTFGTDGTLTAPGNIIANNIGNISALSLDGSNSNVLYGNGVFAPGGSGSYGDSNVTTLLGTFGSNSIVTTGNIDGGNILASGTSSTVVRRAFGLVPFDTEVQLDDLYVSIDSGTTQLKLRTSGSWQGTGWTDTYAGGQTTQTWINLPLNPGFTNASGSLNSQGNGCKCVISDQTPSAKMYEITVVRSGTTGNQFNISIERLV